MYLVEPATKLIGEGGRYRPPPRGREEISAGVVVNRWNCCVIIPQLGAIQNIAVPGIRRREIMTGVQVVVELTCDVVTGLIGLCVERVARGISLIADVAG